MIPSSIHAARRARLRELVDGPILLSANGTQARNLPMNQLPFRQDSTFLYYTGCEIPWAAVLMHDGRTVLFAPEPDDDDELWHGPTASLASVGATLGMDETRPLAELEHALQGLTVRTLAVADNARSRDLARWSRLDLHFGERPGDEALIDAVITQRRTKGPEEFGELRRAATHTAAAFDAVIGACRPGGHERELAALFEAVLGARGCTTGYSTILTQRGEVLHNHAHDEPLEAGRLLLLDGGGEVPSGYGVDVTRTWPVNGRFEPRQRAAYEAVLQAQLDAIDRCTPGTPYRDVHLCAARTLARFLADEGLLRGDPDEAVDRGAHALFFPHGVGHLLGLDVHDLEAFGDRGAYPPGASRSDQFGLSYLRLDLPLEPGWVVTIEPGFYVVPAILGSARFRQAFADAIDFDRAEAWLGFGGIRIEDDVLVTDLQPEVLTSRIPKTLDALEARIGAGTDTRERLR